MSSPIQKCNSCGKCILRRFSHHMNSGKWRRSIYVDELGRQWNGNQCPPCKFGFEKKRTKKTKRICRRCNKPLYVNYFYHPQCLDIEEKRAGYIFEEVGFVARSNRKYV